MSNQDLSEETVEFERLLDYLKQGRGFDFTGYKRSTLVRRIVKRLETINVETFGDYIDYLEVHPEEFVQLFNTILINVTGFFRDEKAWAFIDEQILPRILANKGPMDPIRIWSAGCASGEEAYTISMLLADRLGIEGFRERVKVYATDLDDDALTKARMASYTEKEVESVPPQMLAKYFERANGHFIFNKELRRSVIFGRHDLIQDAPISRIDLLICRNVIMYFHAETQARILTRLSYSLGENGFLFVGKAEMLVGHNDLFIPVDLKNRVFSKAQSVNLHDHMRVLLPSPGNEIGKHAGSKDRLREAAFTTGAVAQLVVDSRGYLCMINDKAKSLFNLSFKDLDQPFQNLELSYRPVELRSAIQQVYLQNAPILLKEIEMPANSAGKRFLDIHLMPLRDAGGDHLGVGINFIDVTAQKQLHQQYEQTNQELETALEELQSTNEELETTNEELQSTIEELETTNEELQSTNEELETMNEELQSGNDELEAMNDELNLRTREIHQANAFLEAILTSLGDSVIVVDTDLNVIVWNRKSEDLWGLRSEEVYNHNLFGLDIGLPVDQLKKPIRSILNHELNSYAAQVTGTSRRGKTILCDVMCSQLVINKDMQGVIIIVEQRGIVGEDKGNNETGG